MVPDILSADEIERQHRAYRQKRLRWMRHIGLPASEKIDEPDPGELPLDDPENG